MYWIVSISYNMNLDIYAYQINIHICVWITVIPHYFLPNTLDLCSY